MTSKRDDLELAPHPTRSTAWVLGALGGCCAIAAGIQGSYGELPIVLPLAAGLFGWLGGWIAVSGRAAQANNKGVNLMALGRLDDAEKLFERHATAIRWAGYARALDLHRAAIAFRRGELPRALELADRAIAHRRRLLVRIYDDAHRDAAFALRSLLRASSGDAAGSRHDIEVLRKGEAVDAELLAIAELAEAVNLERAGSTAALRDHLGRRKTLLLGWLKPRERALVRAMARKLDRERTTVYRTAASRDAKPLQEPALADWMDAIVPGMGAFAARQPARAATATAPAPRADPAAVEAVRRGVGKPRGVGGQAAKTLALWVLLVIMFLAIWQFFTPSVSAPPRLPSPVEPEAPFDWTTAAVIAGVFALLFARVAHLVIRAQRGRRALFAAVRAVALDDPAGPDRIEAVAAKAPPAIAAWATHWLAELADRRGDFAAALAVAEAGIAKISTRALEAATSDWVLPELWSDRAFAKLLLGRRDAALAEMAVLAERFPSFPFHARASFRVELVDRLRRGDVASAGALAAGAQDVPMAPRVELLADLARALADPATPEVERTRVHAELRADEPSARWIRLVAPDVLDAFLRPSATPEEEREAAAEAEAIAEAEVAAPGVRREPSV